MNGKLGRAWLTTLQDNETDRVKGRRKKRKREKMMKRRKKKKSEKKN